MYRFSRSSPVVLKYDRDLRSSRPISKACWGPRQSTTTSSLRKRLSSRNIKGGGCAFDTVPIRHLKMQSRASSSSASSSSSDVTISDSTNSHVKKEETQTLNSPDLGNVEKGEEKAEKPAEQAPAPYSLFTVNRVQKWTIVILASIASFISPTTGSIYLPVIPTIAHVSDRSQRCICRASPFPSLTLDAFSLFLHYTLSLFFSSHP